VPQATYESVTLEIEPGTLMLVYTDGLSETRNPQGEMFGEQRVLSALIGFRGEELLGLVEDLLSRGVDFRGSRPQEDDMTVLAAQFEPAE
jgi:sigma-B regulation protein RsbU (phosphoserine phosphatase)